MKSNKNIITFSAILLIAIMLIPAYAENEVPLKTAKILATYKIKQKKVEKAKLKFIKMAKKTAVINLSKEKSALTQAADLDRAIAARDLLRTIKSSDGVPEISADDKKYRTSSIQIIKTYKKLLDKANAYSQKNTEKIKKELISELTKAMLKMNKNDKIADSLETKDVLNKIEEEDFSLLDFKFTVKKSAQKKEKPPENVAKVTKLALKPKIDYDELIMKTALALGSNILADDNKIEKGLIYICFAESLKPQDKTILSVRKKIENNLFLSILPCSMSQEDFIKLLKSRIKTLLTENKNNAALPKYCVMLSHLNPASKKDKTINDFLTEKNIQNNINIVLKYSKDMFGGTNEAEEIRIQIDKSNPLLTAQLLNKARILKQRFPKNKNVKKLLDDLSQIKVIERKTKPASKPLIKKIDCDKCKGKGTIQKDCPDCKNKKNAICNHCIGSGVLVTIEKCPDCKGKGKSWFGIKCKKCSGTGTIKKKKPCPDCNGTGKLKCKKCINGKISEKCDKCNGTGKISKKSP